MQLFQNGHRQRPSAGFLRRRTRSGQRLSECALIDRMVLGKRLAASERKHGEAEHRMFFLTKRPYRPLSPGHAQ